MSVKCAAAGTAFFNRLSPWDYNAAYTMLAWVKADAINVDGIVLKIRVDSANHDEVMISTADGGKLLYHGILANIEQHATVGTYQPVIGTWFAYAAVRRSPYEILHYAGTSPAGLALIGSKSGGSIAARAAATDFRVASAGGSNGLSGSMAGVRVFPFEMTFPQIQADLARSTPVLPGAWGSWKLPNITTLTDDSGNGRTLSSNGAPTNDAADPPWGAAALSGTALV